LIRCNGRGHAKKIVVAVKAVIKERGARPKAGKIKGAKLFRVTVGARALKSGRGRAVCRVRRRGDAEVMLGYVGGRHSERAEVLGLDSWELLGAVAEGKVIPVRQRRWDLGHQGVRDRFASIKGWRAELRERGTSDGLHPAHPRSELGDRVDGKLHQPRRDTGVMLTRMRQVQEPARNLLNWLHREAAKISSPNFGEKSLNHDGNGVIVCNNHEGIWGNTGLLEAADGKPEQPRPQVSKAVKLFFNRA